MRIALIAPYPTKGRIPGVRADHEHPAPWIDGLARGLLEAGGIELLILSYYRGLRKTHRLSADGMDLVYVPKHEPYRLDPLLRHRPQLIASRRILNAWQPDLVHGFGTETGHGYTAVHMPWPSVVFIQGIIERIATVEPMPKRIERFLVRNEHIVVRNAGVLVAENRFAETWARGINPHADIRIIPHAMNRAFLDTEPTYRDPVILFAGRLSRLKGVDILLEAFARSHASLQLHLAGEGPDRMALEQQAVKLGVSERIRFLGHIRSRDLLNAMEHARALVIPSRMDTSPNIVTEAHAAGLPVIGSRAGGIPEMIEDGVDGRLVDLEDLDGLTKAMELFGLDPGKAAIAGGQGRTKVSVLNDPRRIAEQHITLYRDLISHVAFNPHPSAGTTG